MDVHEARTLRLVVRYDADGLQLLSSSIVDMVAPPSDNLDASAYSLSGSWIEVRNEDGHTTYRRIVHDPLQSTVEAPVISPEAEEAFLERRSVDVVPGEAEFLIPLEPRSVSLHLFTDSTMEGPRAAFRTAEFGQLDLREAIQPGGQLDGSR